MSTPARTRERVGVWVAVFGGVEDDLFRLLDLIADVALFISDCSLPEVDGGDDMLACIVVGANIRNSENYPNALR
jgi:hypothetical protein